MTKRKINKEKQVKNSVGLPLAIFLISLFLVSLVFFVFLKPTTSKNISNYLADKAETDFNNNENVTNNYVNGDSPNIDQLTTADISNQTPNFQDSSDKSGNSIDKSLSNFSINQSGFVGDGTVSGMNLNSMKAIFDNIGITFKNGITIFKEINVDNLNVKTARLNKLEIVDSVTGDIYCTWIENGEWQKIKGGCITTPIIKQELTPKSVTDPKISLMTPSMTSSVSVPAMNSTLSSKENQLRLTSDLIRATTVSLLNRVWNYIDLIVISQAKKLSSLSFVHETKASLLESVNILQDGLFLPVYNYFNR